MFVISNIGPACLRRSDVTLLLINVRTNVPNKRQGYQFPKLFFQTIKYPRIFKNTC
jgi:hypothetical protein